ncbi:MAG: cytochrome b/b6 domain-containing protein [Gemmatimonadaceae bacterium]|nr:cytochrome b/b6 domain-containing protein [Gemmatimonadaceae bacterium]
MIRRLFLLFLLLGTFTQLGAKAALAQTREDCLQCHNDKTLEKEGSNKKSISLFVDEKILNGSTHAKLNCVSCHVGFNPEELPHKAEITPVNCARCHSAATFKHQFHPQLLKAVSTGKIPTPSCQTCHGRHNVASPKEAGNPFSKARLTQDCGQCHKKAAEHFPASAHGKALAQGIKGAPNCLTCHKANVAFVTGSADSLTVKLNQNKLCFSCHLDNEDVKARTSPTAGFIQGYETSVHGQALEKKGMANAANCVSCHGSHDMKRGSDATSFVSRANIPNTCGKCHTKIAELYKTSVHGVEVAKGNDDAPVCTSCHGEHIILGKKDPKSRTAPTNVSAQVCQPCHESVQLSAKYGLRSDRFKTFTDSYHGLASRGGSLSVANCASCHGGHDIKASSDPTSSVNKANLKVTCGKCHPGASERFAQGSVHITLTETDEPVLYWVAMGYIILIVLIIGGMLVHNLLDFVKKSKHNLKVRRGLIEAEHGGHTLYLRMSLNERLQHATLVISFVTLVITGFALKFPEAWWVAPLHRNFPGVFDLRSLVHRIAGVVMLVASVYHIYYIAFVPRGRQLVKDLFPMPQDLFDAINMVKYYVGLRPERPKFGRFGYVEKAEYWALVWGNIVMGATGFILWFDNTFMNLLTKLGWDIARTVHYYEAWLATLAILVWHMYFVIFNPDIYPINLSFWKGTLTEREMLDEHPLELEKLRAQAVEDEDDDEPGVKPA